MDVSRSRQLDLHTRETAGNNSFQYDPLTAGVGLGNVYINAKCLFKLSGVYGAPYGVNVSAFYNARQGYPFEASVQSRSRLNGAGVKLTW